jgi:hypothetical protein
VDLVALAERVELLLGLGQALAAGRGLLLDAADVDVMP